jgi:DNA repair protein RadD
MLRDYQARAIDQLYTWLSKNDGNPCLVLPTGAGKSHIVAALCKDALQNWPDTRVLMLTHIKELIEQNAEKMRLHWPSAPMGIYSAGMKRKELGEPLTFAGIQSIRTKADMIGHIDLIVVDECHLINHKDEGGYRELIGKLKEYNPHLRVIGLTATPYRLGHGYIHQGENVIFNGLVEPVSIEELIFKGFLAPLRSKVTSVKLSTEGVKKRGGEFIESELQKAVDTEQYNQSVVDEVIKLAGNRKAWLFFCAGVDHAMHIKEELVLRGITAECVHGGTPAKERQRILSDYKAGKIKALTNANILTTGFDYPDIDMIAMLRPTLSAALYVQMAGRGLRPKSHTDHCLVLDFAGCVERHGPITNVNPPTKAGEGGEAPVKACENCHEIVHLSAKVCPSCGEIFPEPEKKEKDFRLRNDDIMGLAGSEMEITEWQWRRHVSASSGKEMVKISYYGGLSDPIITEYLPLLHGGFAAQNALSVLAHISNQTGIKIPDAPDIDSLCEVMQPGKPPSVLHYKKDGKFYRVIKRVWDETNTDN